MIATVHPSAVLRAPDRDEACRRFLADLRAVRAHLGRAARRGAGERETAP